MVKVVKHKWLILLIIIVLVIAFDALVHNVSIVNRGIVIGLSIDSEGEELVVATQMILPKNGGIGEGGNNYAVFKAKGKTLREAIGQITEEMGSLASLSHTVVILLSKQLLMQDRFEILEHLLTDDKVNDTVLLAATEGNAADIFDAPVPFGEVASYQLQRILRPVKMSLGLTSVSLKDFFVDYSAQKTAMYMPMVYLEDSKPNTDQEANGAKDSKIIKADRTLVMNKEGAVFELDDLARDGLAMVEHPIMDGSILIEGRNDEKVSIMMLSLDVAPVYNLEENSVLFKADAEVVRGSGVYDEGEVSFRLNEYEIEEIKKEISKRIVHTFNTAKEYKTDIFKLYNGFYRRYGEKWASNATTDYLDKLNISVDVRVTQR